MPLLLLLHLVSVKNYFHILWSMSSMSAKRFQVPGCRFQVAGSSLDVAISQFGVGVGIGIGIGFFLLLFRSRFRQHLKAA